MCNSCMIGEFVMQVSPGVIETELWLMVGALLKASKFSCKLLNADVQKSHL